MGFSRQEYWSGLLFPFLGYLPDPEIKPKPLVSPTLAGEFFTAETPGKPYKNILSHGKRKGLETKYVSIIVAKFARFW